MKWLSPGVLLMAAVAFMQSCFSLIVKTVSTDISTGLQVLVYYLLPLVFLLPLLWRQGKQLYASPYFAWHCLRGSLAAAAVFCFFYSASHLSLAMAAILFNSTPVFIPLFAWLFLGERTSLRVYGGILLALLGVVLALHPTMTQGQWHLGLIALAAGVLMALSQVLLRFMAIKKESVDTTVFHLYLSCTLFTVVVIIVETLYTHHSQLQTHIATNQWLFVAVMLLLLGGLGLLAQRTLTKAFQYLPAAQLVPLLYLSVPFSSLMGWLFWSQRFTSMMLYATVMIVAGICVITLPRRGDV